MCPVKHRTHTLKVIPEGTPQKKLLPVRPKTLRRRKKRKTPAITKRYALKRKRNKRKQPFTIAIGKKPEILLNIYFQKMKKRI